MSNKTQVSDNIQRSNALYLCLAVCHLIRVFKSGFKTLIFPISEVLSPTTEDYDRGTKVKLYRDRGIPSLQDYVVVNSTEYAAEVYTRNNNKWMLTTAEGKDGSLLISDIEYNIKLSDIYAQINRISAN